MKKILIVCVGVLKSIHDILACWSNFEIILFNSILGKLLRASYQV